MSCISFASRGVTLAAAALLLSGPAAALGDLQASLRSVRTGTAAPTGSTNPSQLITNTVFDVTGIESREAYLSQANQVFTLQVGAHAEVVGVGWDVNITAFDPSWLADIAVSVEDSDQTLNLGFSLAPGFNVNNPGTAQYSSNGIVNLVALNLNFQVGADGILRLEFYEDWDDAGVAPDGIWNSGILTIQVADPIPEPSTYGLMALGLFAVVGAARRRRSR